MGVRHTISPSVTFLFYCFFFIYLSFSQILCVKICTTMGRFITHFLHLGLPSFHSFIFTFVFLLHLLSQSNLDSLCFLCFFYVCGIIFQNRVLSKNANLKKSYGRPAKTNMKVYLATMQRKKERKKE